MERLHPHNEFKILEIKSEKNSVVRPSLPRKWNGPKLEANSPDIARTKPCVNHLCKLKKRRGLRIEPWETSLDTAPEGKKNIDSYRSGTRRDVALKPGLRSRTSKANVTSFAGE